MLLHTSFIHKYSGFLKTLYNTRMGVLKMLNHHLTENISMKHTHKFGIDSSIKMRNWFTEPY